MAEDFYKFIEKARKEPLEVKIKKFGEIVEKIMHLTLRIPDLFDKNLIEINNRIDKVETDLHNLNNKVIHLQTQIDSKKQIDQKELEDLKISKDKKIPPDLKKPEHLKAPDERDKEPIRKQSTRKLLMDELRKMFSQNVKGVYKNEIDDNILIQFSEDKELLIPKSKIHSEYSKNTEITQTFRIEAEILRKNNIIE